MPLAFTLRRAIHRALPCRFGWHIGANLPWTEDGKQFARCLWCEREMALIGGEWRPRIMPPKVQAWKKRSETPTESVSEGPEA